jgi:hypothetical protein
LATALEVNNQVQNVIPVTAPYVGPLMLKIGLQTRSEDCCYMPFSEFYSSCGGS